MSQAPLDQTHFIEQAGFEQRAHGQRFNWRDLRSNKNLLPFYLLAVALVLVVVLFFLRLLLASRGEPEEQQFVREQVQVELGPLQTRVYQLRQTLRDSDPTKLQYPFPSVDLELSIN